VSSTERPLRLLLTAFGSRGDVLPRVALGQELQKRGHAVTIGCAERSRPLVRAAGLESVALGDYPPDDVMAEAYARMARDPDAARRGEKLLEALFIPMLPQIADRLELIQHAFDFVVLNDLLAMFAVPPLIELGRFAVALTSQPLGGLAAMLGASPCIKLVGSSPLLLPPEPGLDATFEITDFWFTETTQFRPDPVLAEFVAPAGPRQGTRRPVVAIALGSAWGTLPVMSRQTLSGAARRAGVRLVVQDHTPAPGTSAVSPDGEWVSVGEVPYGWLFERVAAVIHHGGAGTIAEALRAGCPSVTVPHYGDHVYWAQRLVAAGVSAGTLESTTLDEVGLGRLIDRAVRDQALRHRVDSFGSLVDASAGTRRACDVIETLARAERPGPAAG
jgi:UDP:flavonoid glycosyltransferase YjiC (YdhE family)